MLSTSTTAIYLHSYIDMHAKNMKLHFSKLFAGMIIKIQKPTFSVLYHKSLITYIISFIKYHF